MPITRAGLEAMAGEATLQFNTAMTAAQPSDLEGAIFDDVAHGGVYKPTMLAPAGKGRLWVGPRVIKRLQAGGVTIPVAKYEDTYDLDLTDIDDHVAFEKGSVIARVLAESALRNNAEGPIDVLLQNPENPLTGSPMFGTHTFYETDKNGNVVQKNGAPSVLQTIVNDIAGDDENRPAWFVLSEKAILRITQDDYRVQFLDVGSERTFFEDTVTAGWRARKSFTPGLCFAAIRSNKVFSAESYQEALDLGASFRNIDGDRLGTNYQYLVVQKGTADAIAAEKLIKQTNLANGETNIYASRGIKLILI